MKNMSRFAKFLFIFPKVLFIFMALAVFPQTALTANASDLTLKDAFISKHPLKGRPSSAYFTLINSWSKDCVLSGISIGDKFRIEMHETLMRNGIMKMVKRDEMIVPAGGELVFERGGKHLMIFGITDETGGLPLKFSFRNCPSFIKTVPMRGPRDKKASHH